jgi:hypothetical protein
MLVHIHRPPDGKYIIPDTASDGMAWMRSNGTDRHHKGMDRVGDHRKLAGILECLTECSGKRFDASDFWSRFRIQKSIYLLKAMGYPGISGYRFNLYLRGPYSPDLAKDYYALEKEGKSANPRIPPAHIPPDKLAVLKEALDNGEYFLEALVTLLSIVKSEGRDKAKAIEIAARLKPNRASYFESAWQFLTDKGLI